MDALRGLREILLRHTTATTGLQESVIPGLGFFRADEPSTPTPNVYDPMLCIVVAGRKRGFIGSETLEYTPGDAILISVDLPVVGTILEASPSAPYLALRLRWDRLALASVILDEERSPDGGATTESGLRVQRADPDLLDAALRLARLLDRPQDIAELAPLFEREILYRLLTGPSATTLRELARSESRLSQISRAAVWLRENYAETYSAETLAKVTSMSISSLNRHFRAITAMSPLEYHKRLRLMEARRLLVAGEADVSEVGQTVGYSSASQFTREYRRLFGEPPGRDAGRIRRATTAVETRTESNAPTRRAARS
ncbi:MAG: AraC family transcriptional regulator [Planctomycetes bacterium]|nr:AraC family transcriptional regulator [Planctomycetota bacterium]